MPAHYRNIARVVKPHGSKGEVIVLPLDGLPFLLYEGLRVALTPPALERDRFCTVETLREGPSGDIVRFSGIDGLDAASKVAGCYVLAAEDDLDLGPLDAAYDDLLGREVVDERYGPLGTIEDILENPVHDVWCVRGPYGEVLVPVVEAALDGIPEDGPIFTHVMDGLVELSAGTAGAAGAARPRAGEGA